LIQESLIVGTLWYVLKRIWDALSGSAPGRAFDALCRWIAREWNGSAIITWFCSPRYLADEGVQEPGRLRRALCGVYAKLRLNRLLEGSIFLRCFLWCGAAAVFSAVLPTMAVLGLAMVGYGSTALSLLHEPGRRLEREPLLLPVAAYMVCYLAATLTSVDVRGSLLIGVLSVVFIGFSVVLSRSVETRAQLDLLVALLVTVGAAVSCHGILQYIFRWGYQSAAWVDEDMFSSIQFRVGGTMQNPNMLGQYLILMIPLGGAKLLGAKGLWRRLYYLACCGVMCICMILTFSRGAWLGLLFAGLVFFVVLEPRLLFLAPVALLVLWAALPATVIDRFTSIGDLADQSTSYRVSIWFGTIHMLRDGYWLAGIGPGTAAFNAIYPRYSYATIVAPHAHNLFLQILCDGGIVTLLVFLWVLLRYFRTLAHALRTERDTMSRLLQIACASGLLGFLVQSMTDYSFYNYRVMFLFWVYVALGSLSARRSRMPEGRVSA